MHDRNWGQNFEEGSLPSLFATRLGVGRHLFRRHRQPFHIEVAVVAEQRAPAPVGANKGDKANKGKANKGDKDIY